MNPARASRSCLKNNAMKKRSQRSRGVCNPNLQTVRVVAHPVNFHHLED